MNCPSLFLCLLNYLFFVPDRGRPFSFLFFQWFNSMWSTHTSTFDTSSTRTPVDTSPESSCSCFSPLIGFFGFILTLGISASKGSSSSSFPTSTSAQDSPTGSMSSPIGATSRLRVFVGLTSALLYHLRFPIVDSSLQDHDQHRSRCCSLLISLLDSSRIENVVFEIDWNEFVLSIPIHQFLKMNSHSLTNFTVMGIMYHRRVRG